VAGQALERLFRIPAYLVAKVERFIAPLGYSAIKLVREFCAFCLDRIWRIALDFKGMHPLLQLGYAVEQDFDCRNSAINGNRRTNKYQSTQEQSADLGGAILISPAALGVIRSASN
jgi:hypothetical protein